MAEKYCDDCLRAEPIRKLNMDFGGVKFLCKHCWNKEMRWRRQENKKIARSRKTSSLGKVETKPYKVRAW